MHKRPVVFVDGVHYAAHPEGHDEAGHADLSKPLRWENDGYRPAKKDEPLHNDVHHEQSAILDTALVPAQPGRPIYPVGVHVHSDDAKTYFLIDENDVVHREHPLRWDPDIQAFRAAGGDA